MPDNLRIGIDEVRKRMEAGEDIVFVDTRNPQAWAQSDVTLPKAIRIPADDLDKHLSAIPKDKMIIAYCT
jgi:rhodanese-related sulfurtransferase